MKTKYRLFFLLLVILLFFSCAAQVIEENDVTEEDSFEYVYPFDGIWKTESKAQTDTLYLEYAHNGINLRLTRKGAINGVLEGIIIYPWDDSSGTYIYFECMSASGIFTTDYTFTTSSGSTLAAYNLLYKKQYLGTTNSQALDIGISSTGTPTEYIIEDMLRQ